MRSSSISMGSPRQSSAGRTPRRAAAPTRATSSRIENGLTRESSAPISSACTRSCSVPRAETTTIGVPIPSARAVSISFHPSSSGSIRSSTQTSGFSKRSRASPSSPRPTTTGSKPAAERWRAMPSAITASSSTIRTRATAPTIDPCSVGSRCPSGDDLVNEHGTYDRSFDALRTGFTAAVSHELRTPLARILALLESAELPDADVAGLIDQARAEVENAGVLIDEILFLSELESGREVVSLGHTPALPVLHDVARDLEQSAARAGVELRVEGDPEAEVPLRPR